MGMEPINEQPVGSDLPKAVARARIVMYVQGAAAIVVPIIVAIATGGPDNSADNDEARGRGLWALLGLAVIIGLIVVATKLKSRKPAVRTWALVLEWILVAFAILSLVQGGFGAIVSLALAGYVIFLLMSAEGKAAFTMVASTEADATRRFDIRDFPR